MFCPGMPLVLVLSLINTALAVPTPETTTAATTAATTTTATPELISPIGPIRFDYTVLSFNYFEDINCATPQGSMNISSLDMDRKTCFALPGNSLVFTYQLHEGTLSYYNPNEVNMHSYSTKECYMPPGGPSVDGYMGGLGGCFDTSTLGSFQAVWGEG